MTVDFQIGQCRIYVDTDRTKEFYETLPRISENCNCGDCVYFENEVIKKDIPLFRILKKMCVDLTRQPNINPDGVCSVGLRQLNIIVHTLVTIRCSENSVRLRKKLKQKMLMAKWNRWNFSNL